ncbi:MAG: 4Fe-4S binding protein [Deltaproteobacteria bacterium]|nr:4Fe-4S binding protein [Deltaproteobacteria bacterium]
MAEQGIYEDLRKAIKRAGGALPAIGIDELYALLKELFTPEEAALLISMPNALITAKDHAATLGRAPDEIEAMMEAMTNKGLLHAGKNAEGIYEYIPIPLLPGIYEMQFYRGTKTERDYRLARLFKDYLDTLQKLRESLPTPPPLPETSYFRVLPVEKEVSSAMTVLPYAQLSKYVEQTSAIAVGTCYCRHHAILIDERDNCGVSHSNCMAFGAGAIFAAERNMGRLISKEEALKILAEAEEEGLVHCTANTSEELIFICNCCSCHCGILRQAKWVPDSWRVLTSGYHAEIDDTLCSGCEVCLDRCPVSAIKVTDTANVDTMRCIGCGLCVDTCPTEAIRLVLRAEAPAPPRRMGHLERAVKKP